MHTPASLLRRNGTPVEFSAIAKGKQFEFNGNVWLKHSTRTAVMYWPAGPAHPFYFGKRDICRTERAA